MKTQKVTTSIKAAPAPADDPNEKPYPGYAREASAMAAKTAEAERSRAAALPGPLREAFAGEPFMLYGMRLQPVSCWLVAILTRIHSPLLEVLQLFRDHADEIAKATQAEALLIQDRIAAEASRNRVAPETIIETVFAFVTPVEDAQRMLDDGTFRQQALAKIGRFHPSDLVKMQRAVGSYYCGSFSTALSIVPVAPEGGNGEVFSVPPPTTKTASAGGSR